MTTLTPVAAWLRTRTPPPPDALRARMDAMTAGQERDASLPVALLASAQSAMTSLLAHGCLTRESALDLLAVDALVTYAFEAAADQPDRLEERSQHALAAIAALAEPYRV